MTGWIQAYSGRVVYPLNLRLEDISILDIAHSLSNQCRFSGHCGRYYSVAEHSVLMAQYVPQKYKLEALLHDATEAYLSDMPRPVKHLLPEYVEAERRAARVIAERFGLPAGMSDVVRDADNRILLDEREQNMNISERPWGLQGRPLGVTLQFWDPIQAKVEFMRMYHDLA